MQRFEWDATKDRTNQRKHGFGFRTAARVFEDPNIVLIEDRIDEEGEQRWHALGMVGGRFLLIVVHVYRESENGEEIIRIISAREANQHEGRVYFQQAADEAAAASARPASDQTGIRNRLLRYSTAI